MVIVFMVFTPSLFILLLCFISSPLNCTSSLPIYPEYSLLLLKRPTPELGQTHTYCVTMFILLAEPCQSMCL